MSKFNKDEAQRINAKETPRRIAPGDSGQVCCTQYLMKPRTRHKAILPPSKRPKFGGAWQQKARGSYQAIFLTKARGKGSKYRHSLFRRVVRKLHDSPIQSHSQERKQYMATDLGLNQLTPEQRLAEIAACLAQGIVDFHKQGRLGISTEEFPTDSQASLDFGLDSGLSVNSGSISCYSNNSKGGTNVVECD